jgi:HSP20 family protein
MTSHGPSSVESNPADLADDVRRLFEDLATRRPDRRHVVAGECIPLVDVLETGRNVEIVLDLPGVAADALRVVIKSGVVLIVGEKERSEPAKRAPASFHLVERDFGRFARAVRIHSPIDATSARAWLSSGELRIVIPRVHERRGQPIHVPILSAAEAAGS